MKRAEPFVTSQPYDLLIVGGGINGAGIARDAAGRGLKVLLCEKGDLAEGTSSASTKLIHGGLRYLEYYDFKLVRHSLKEREVLLRNAPHIIWPLRFVLPHGSGQRPAWLIRLGLFIYDHLGGREILPASKAIDLSRHVAGEALKPEYRNAFIYSDCWADDARLVALNAIDASERGAAILTRTECRSARWGGDIWVMELEDKVTGERFGVNGRAVVNCAGPWVNDVLAGPLGQNVSKKIRNVKGSHIVVPKLFDHPYPYIFQNRDKRIVFAIPYEEGFTLLGTTDEDYHGDPGQVSISQGEVTYLCDVVSGYFRKRVRPVDVVWSYSGVRPLFDAAAGSASAATRDYVLDLSGGSGKPILLNVYGGKITTFRKLSEQAVDGLVAALGMKGAPWTSGTALPGGDIVDADFNQFLAKQRECYPWLADSLVTRFARSYGTRMDLFLSKAASLEDLGKDFGGGLYQVEIDYLVQNEFARTAEDVLWRRSKLGLHVPDGTTDRVDECFLDGGPKLKTGALGK